MKKSSFAFLAAALVLVLAIGVLLYPKLAKTYSPHITAKAENPSATESDAKKTPDVTVPSATDSGVKTAPDFTVTSSNGISVKLSDYSGKPVIVNFWATWCSPCKSELPHFEDMYKKYGDSITFMMVNLTDGYRDTESGVSDFIKKNKYTFPVYLDLKLEAADTYAIYSIPTTVLINADGKIVDTLTGTLTESQLQKCIDTLNAG